MLNNKPPELFKASYNSSVTNTGYSVYLSGYAQHILRSESTFALTIAPLQRALDQLRSMPRPIKGGFEKIGSTDTRMVTTPSHKIMYKVASGQVHVFNIITNNALAEARARLEKPGLYKISKDKNGNWKNKGKVSNIGTTYAAVNGQSNTLSKHEATSRFFKWD